MPVLFSNLILTVAIAILSESTLSILGLGDPNSILGRDDRVKRSRRAPSPRAWWWLMAPEIALVMVMLAFTMCGYALDEIINPRLRER